MSELIKATMKTPSASTETEEDGIQAEALRRLRAHHKSKGHQGRTPDSSK